MLKDPEDGELPEAEKADRLPTRITTQTPDVKSICQRPLVILPQSVDISKHADDGHGNGRLVVPKKTAEDEICCPLAISKLSGGLLPVPPQDVRQISNPHGRRLGTVYSTIIIEAQNL